MSMMQVYPLRLLPGQELTSSLQQFVVEKKLHAAFVLTCVGSVKSVDLRFATDKEGLLKISELRSNLEICSLVGTISKDGFHLHGTFGDAEGYSVSGHVMGNMIVQTTAEIIVGNVAGSEFKRILDNQTGFRELVIEKEDPTME